MKTAPWNVFVHPSMNETATKFQNYYRDVSFVICNPQERKILKPKQQRVCRFCGKGMPEVKFKSDAHVIPYMLGNKSTLSDFECDNCNNQFSRLETDLSNYLGIERLLHRVKSQSTNKFPNFASTNQDLTGGQKEFYGTDAVEIRKPTIESESIKFESSNGETKISYKGQPYIPENVYKIFLKIALSSIPKSEVVNYKAAFEYLRGSYVPNAQFQFVEIIQNFGGNIYSVPVVMIFNRIDDVTKQVLKHWCCIYFWNKMISFPIPFHLSDLTHHTLLQEVTAPYYSFHPIKEDVRVEQIVQNFSSKEKQRGHVQNIQFTADIRTENLVMYNPETNEHTQVDRISSEIVSIIFLPEDQHPTFPGKDTKE